MAEKITVTKTDTTGLYDSLLLKSASGAGYVDHENRLYQVMMDTEGDYLFVELDLYDDLLSSTSLSTSKGKKYSYRKLTGES